MRLIWPIRQNMTCFVRYQDHLVSKANTWGLWAVTCRTKVKCLVSWSCLLNSSRSSCHKSLLILSESSWDRLSLWTEAPVLPANEPGRFLRGAADLDRCSSGHSTDKSWKDRSREEGEWHFTTQTNHCKMIVWKWSLDILWLLTKICFFAIGSIPVC